MVDLPFFYCFTVKFYKIFEQFLLPILTLFKLIQLTFNLKKKKHFYKNLKQLEKHFFKVLYILLFVRAAFLKSLLNHC